MIVRDAQLDLRRAFVGGGPGVFVSGLVWVAAALVEQSRGVGTAFALLFFGGMLIFPISLLASRTLFRRTRQSPDNPLGGLALESTIAMIGGLFAAWLFLPYRPDYVFPLAAIAVGTHYAVFRTIYGDRLFWLLGGLITAVGLLGIYRFPPSGPILQGDRIELTVVPVPGGPILAVGLIELLFAFVLTIRERGAHRHGAEQ